MSLHRFELLQELLREDAWVGARLLLHPFQGCEIAYPAAEPRSKGFLLGYQVHACSPEQVYKSSYTD